MIRFDDVKGLRRLFKLMIFGTIVSFILIFGYNYYQKEEYPQPSFEQRIKGRIIHLPKYQSVVMIELDNHEKYMIFGSRNYKYDPYILQDFLQRNDLIEKEANSNLIRINRGDSIFTFEIGKDLNKELWRQ